jgi:hypothetical protein
VIGNLHKNILKQCVIPPANVARESAKGLALRKMASRSSDIKMAKQLCRRTPMKIRDVQKMNSFFFGNVIRRGESRWLMWGGDAGWDWSILILMKAHKVNMFAGVLRELGQTEIPDNVWSNSRRYGESETSVERLRKLFSQAMQAKEEKTRSKTRP